MASDSPPQFSCDAMLGSLARWLRAAGYDACWRVDIGDRELIELALRESRILLTSDSGVFLFGIVRDSELPALLVPRGLKKQEQLAFVLNQLKLPARQPRCMTCGGELVEVAKELVRERVPARTFDWLDQFYECNRCGKVFWQGTHWQRIAHEIQQVMNSEQSKKEHTQGQWLGV